MRFFMFIFLAMLLAFGSTYSSESEKTYQGYLSKDQSAYNSVKSVYEKEQAPFGGSSIERVARFTKQKNMPSKIKGSF